MLDLNQLHQDLEKAANNNDWAAVENFKWMASDFLDQNPNLIKSDPELYNQYKDFWAKASFVGLNALHDEEVINLFKNNLLSAFSINDYDAYKDVVNKLKVVLLKKGSLDYRDALKNDLRDAILQNNQAPFVAAVPQKTIAQWIKDYVGAVGIKPISDKLKLIEYLNKLSIELHLNSSDREKLLKLFNLFEFLKLSSYTPQGYETVIPLIDFNGKFKLYDDGREVLSSDEIVPLTETPLPSSAVSSRPVNQPPINNVSIPPPQSVVNSSASEINDFTLPPVEASKNIVSAPVAGLDYSSAVNQLITQLGLSFAGDVLKSRFANVLTSYLKGIRKEIELREVLARDSKTGGMGYDQAMVTRITDKIAELKKSLTPMTKTNISKPSLAEGLRSPAEMVIPQSEAFKSGTEKLLTEPEDVLLPSGEPADLEIEKKQFTSGPLSPPVAEIKATPASTSVPSVSAEKDVWNLDLSSEIPDANLSTPPPTNLPEASNEINFGLFDNQPPDGLLNNFNFEPSSAPTPPSSEPPTSPFLSPSINPPPTKPIVPESTIQNVYHTSTPTPKPMTEEIRVTPKIYGPIDELKTITIEDWRRWGTAKEGEKRILDKINLLAEESLVKKSQGITAWKNSAVNHMYLDIGTEAIDNGLSVDQVIAKRQQEGRPSLTIEEFNAVSELNQKLRF